jgi:hypothetical protein
MSHSFSGKICPQCSNSTLVIDNRKLSYTSLGTSIQCDTFKCPHCELKIKHRRAKQIFDRRKMQGGTLARNPLSNLSVERKINPLKILSTTN